MSDTIPEAADNAGAWGFTRRDAARLAAVVKRVEHQYRNPPPARGKWPTAGASIELVRIWLPTGITAGTFGAPSSKTDAILAVRSANGWTTSGQPTIKVYNCDTTAVTGAKAAWAKRRADGTYELVVADC